MALKRKAGICEKEERIGSRFGRYKVGVEGFRMVEFRTLLCCRQVTEFHKVCSLKKAK